MNVFKSAMQKMWDKKKIRGLDEFGMTNGCGFRLAGYETILS